MQPTILPIHERTRTGHSGARDSRRRGFVPAVVYGASTPPRAVEIDERVLDRHLRHHGATSLVRLDIDGDTSLVALVQAIQRAPVTHRVLHVDFHAVVLDEAVHVSVPVELVGPAAGERHGGVLQPMVREIEIKCLPLQMPESLSVDITALELGESLTVGAVPLPEHVELVTDPDTVLVVVSEPILVTAEVEEAAETPAEEGAQAAAHEASDE